MDAILHTPNIDITQDATATAAQILSGYTAYAKGAKLSGSMANRGNISATLNAGDSFVIPEGYHTGAGRVTANSLASQTGASATTAQILSGYTAWANGQYIVGSLSMPDDQLSKLRCVTLSRQPSTEIPQSDVSASGALIVLFTRTMVPSSLKWQHRPPSTFPYCTARILPNHYAISSTTQFYLPILTNTDGNYPTAAYLQISVHNDLKTISLLRLVNSSYGDLTGQLTASSTSARYAVFVYY